MSNDIYIQGRDGQQNLLYFKRNEPHGMYQKCFTV